VVTDGKSIIRDIRQQLSEIKDDSHAKILGRFFKTGPGQYGEGDIFIGLRVPQLRTLSRIYEHLRLEDALELMRSPVHEERLLALLILVRAYKNSDETMKEKIYRFYLDNTRFINNWDLVDLSAEHIMGAHLFNRDREQLAQLVHSKILWDRRIAVMATFHFIRKGQFTLTLSLVESLLGDKEDLIHKACGWMLREIGKRDIPTEETFLRMHYKTMPRTMLRYAIERFPGEKRLKYLRGTFDRD
jgi:3-methyladenine DNA glycosylase AlkD